MPSALAFAPLGPTRQQRGLLLPCLPRSRLPSVGAASAALVAALDMGARWAYNVATQREPWK